MASGINLWQRWAWRLRTATAASAYNVSLHRGDRLRHYKVTKTEVMETKPLAPLLCPPPRDNEDIKTDDDRPSSVAKGCVDPVSQGGIECVDGDAQLLQMTCGSHDCAKLAALEMGCQTQLPQDSRYTITDLGVCQCACPAMEVWPPDHFGVMLTLSPVP